MRSYQLLDSLPIVYVFVAITIVSAIVAECGYRLGALVAEPHVRRESGAHGNDRRVAAGTHGFPSGDHHGNGIRSLR